MRNIWKEGDVFDLWTVNHVLAGALLGALSHMIGIYFWPAIIVSVLLFLCWEVYEKTHDIKETWANRIADVVTAIIGFLIFYLLFGRIESPSNFILFIILAVAWGFLEMWGYLSYKRRG